MISRRQFVVLAGAAVVAPHAGVEALAPHPGDPRIWLACIHDLAAAGRVGARLQPGLGDAVRDLCAESAARLDALVGDARPARLNDLIAEDFRRGRTVTLEGVALSRTEVVLYDRAYRATTGT